MFDYRWAEVAVGNGPDDTLTSLGADGWEAVGMTVTGEHFGETWVRVLLKRPMAADSHGLVDVSFDRRRADRRRYPATG